MNKNLIVIFGVIIIIFTILFFGFNNSSETNANPNLSETNNGYTEIEPINLDDPSAFIVNITEENGYEIKDFTIKKGQTVVFKNLTADGNFWPASNIHPTHQIYPEFDPKEPIPPAGEWGLKFNNAGIWRWHDHLRPSIKGIITVEE
ncbi:MAG TPA: hypothetical protein VI432_00230 [Candidatus Paceibacterota bacterium]